MNLRLKERCLAALREQREKREFEVEALENAMDEINVLLDPRPAPRNWREMRTRIRELRREREERDRVWRKKALFKGLIRLGCLASCAAGLIYASIFGEVAALVSSGVISVVLGIAYYAHIKTAAVIRSSAHQEGAVDTPDGR